MNKQNKIAVDTGLKAVLQELEENPYRKFKIAFSLMSIIPFLVFFYLLVSRLFTMEILASDIGIILSIAIFISLCGFFVGYSIIKNILNKIILYAAQAKHSDQLKSTFVASVSHEIKNPLSAIKTNLFNIMAGLVGSVNEEQKKILQLCDNIIERMKHLVNDLLDLHKIEAGMVDVKRKLCNLLEVLEKQIKEFEAMLNKKRIKLIKEILDKDLSIWADEDKIMLVINNLLSNAIKYTPEEGLVTLKIYPADEYIKLEFLDTAQSIPSDKLEKIFDKFERLDITKEGTGLGLAITKDIVEMHKGRIWVESQPGRGNKFVVVLPRDLRETKR
jgi:signal transduction histidine kinase